MSGCVGWKDSIEAPLSIYIPTKYSPVERGDFVGNPSEKEVRMKSEEATETDALLGTPLPARFLPDDGTKSTSLALSIDN